MAGIRFEGVAKRFGEVVALEAFTLDVADGEFVVLVGPSGCGKTTSLRILAGLETASEGSVRVGGRDLTRVPAKDRNLAMVFQSYALYPHMTARANIGFALSLRGIAKPQIAAEVDRVAAMLDIADLLDRRPRELSGGQRQRVAVARAIVRDPDAFLFDEPLSNLDAKLRSSARVEIRKLQKAVGTTTVYVTHDQIEAMTMADRIVVMNRGRIEQVGPPLEVYLRPATAFVAAFIGNPPMNLMQGRRGGSGELRVGEVTLPLPPGPPCRDTELTVGLRPEALRLDGGRSDDGVEIAGDVRHVETLGPETLLEVASPMGTLHARLPGVHTLHEGERVRLAFDPEALHLFDGRGARVEA